jgi:DNA-3-methyladenine glycosylase
MFLEGGHAYIYFIYGVHYCFNVVTGESGRGEAVLVRGIEPTEGIELMIERRGAALRNHRHLADGPGKLTVALGIGPELNGVDLVTDPRIWIETGIPVDDSDLTITPRIGITKGLEHHWRWIVPRR